MQPQNVVIPELAVRPGNPGSIEGTEGGPG